MPNMARKTLPEMIIEHRKATGLSRERYAKSVGMSPTELERIEKDRFRRLRPNTVLKLSVYTGYTPAEIWAAINRKEAAHEHLR